MTATNTSVALVEKAFEQATSAPEKSFADLVIWGGKFPDSQTEAFLSAWGQLLITHLPWRMYEYVSRFLIRKATSQDDVRPTSFSNLERARLFGGTGDLDLRRDGDIFRWRFMGQADQAWPVLPDTFELHDFWIEHSADPPRFAEIEQSYYHWRAGDQRVSQDWWRQAGLPGRDVYLQQRHYLHKGRLAFVRYIGFVI